MNEPITTEEQVAVIYDRTARIEKLLLGNGQPGVVSRLTTLETQIDERDKIARKSGSVGGVVGAGVTTLIALVLQRVGL